MSGNPSTQTPVIKVYAHVPCKRTQRIVEGFNGILVDKLPSVDEAVWLVADTQLRKLGATNYRDFVWDSAYTLVVGPDTAIVQVPEGSMTIHIPTSNGKSIYADQALAITLEYLYGTS